MRTLDGWQPTEPGRVSWTDDYSSVLAVMLGS